MQNDDEEMLVPHSDLVVEGPQPEGPQPMEVVTADNNGSVENQASDEPQASRFTWTIDNFTRVTAKKLYSDVFVVEGHKWRVLIFPKGNNVDYLSAYLDAADSSTLPYGWSRHAQFSLAVVNQMNSKYSIKKDTQHQFNQRESAWGFTSFMGLNELYDPNKGYLVNDTCIIEADVAVRKVVDTWAYDSKKEMGYVGLKNQGATCYMNSLLQTLYHIPYFRKAVYHMPTTENDNITESIPLALQSLFYKLQYDDTSVSTKELTKSFGWDTYDSFMQHDVQELNRVLCEKLEDKMKGTVVEGTIPKLFEGHHINYIECINVDFKSTRKESFYDLQLDVKGCKDVYDSFDKYVKVERLEGDNKYHAEGHGLQDAKKGVLFIDFPPVLQLQLKRFEYDFTRDTMVKINDRYEFPLELDLDRDNGKYLSPDADKSLRNLYMLHSVTWNGERAGDLRLSSLDPEHGRIRDRIGFSGDPLIPTAKIVVCGSKFENILVHSGGAHGGHYYACIRPTLSDQWYKFDDERVTKEDVKRALEEHYGGEEELPLTNSGYNSTPFKFAKDSNAYMLVYIRVSDKDKIICDVDEKEIAEHLRIRLKKEQEEKEDKRRYKAQTLKVAFHHATKDEAVIINIRLPKQATVGDALDEIKKKADLSHPNAELRLLEVFCHKIYKIFPVQETIDNINDQYWTLRAEEIPEEEKNLGPNDRLIHAYHSTKEKAQNQVQVQNSREPFLLVIHEGETLADVKVRIQKKCQVTDEEFSKWKVAFLSLGRREYLEDSTIISSRFQRRDVYGAWEQYLVLEHPDTNPKSSTINKNSTQLKLVEEKVIDMKPAKSSPFRKSKAVSAINPKYTAVIAYEVPNGLVIFADGKSSLDDGTTLSDINLKVRRITKTGLYMSFSGDTEVCEEVYKAVFEKYGKVEPKSISRAGEYVKKCISKLGPCDVILIGRLKSELVLASVRSYNDNTKIKVKANEKFVKIGGGRRFMAEKLPAGVLGEEEGMRFGADQLIEAIKIDPHVGGFVSGLFIDMKYVLRQVLSPGSGLTVAYELIYSERKLLRDDDESDGWPVVPPHLL